MTEEKLLGIYNCGECGFAKKEPTRPGWLECTNSESDHYCHSVKYEHPVPLTVGIDEEDGETMVFVPECFWDGEDELEVNA